MLGSTGRLLIAFAVGSVGTIAGTLLAMRGVPLKSLGADAWKVCLNTVVLGRCGWNSANARCLPLIEVSLCRIDRDEDGEELALAPAPADYLIRRPHMQQMLTRPCRSA